MPGGPVFSGQVPNELNGEVGPGWGCPKVWLLVAGGFCGLIEGPKCAGVVGC